MKNMLMGDIDYKIEQTSFGVWRRYLYPGGLYFEEFISHQQFFGMPLLHYTRGICPETGKRKIAKGVIAVGRLAMGILAIGHASMGMIAIGQLAIGIVFGLGQACTGLFAIGQLAIAILIGLGQFVTGYIAVGQFAIGGYVLAQLGFGQHVWGPKSADPEAVRFFRSLISRYLER